MENKLNRNQIEQFIKDGYSARMLSCHYGVDRNTITNWIKKEYSKTYIELKKEVNSVKTKN